VIIEMGLKELPIDPSFGSHFFQNITNLHISYFTIDNKQKDDILNIDFLTNFDTKNSGKYIDWYSFEKPFNIMVDGSNGIGIIEKPNTSLIEEVMDEEESSGI
jgi:hypothetical protein